MSDKINDTFGSCETKPSGVKGFEAVLWHSRLVA